MVYQGSKARLLKYIKPYIQKCIDSNTVKTYIEPFVGGANVIPYIDCEHKLGSDINGELISLLRYMKENPELSVFPKECSFEHYADVRKQRRQGKGTYMPFYTAGIGYFASYGGRYFDGGYGRDSKGGQSIYTERLNNARKQAKNLKGIVFTECSFEDYFVMNCFIYCDPPYFGTKTYDSKQFDYALFYNWLRKISQNNYVLVSEYSMPSDFECIWSKERSVLQKSDRTKGDKATECLFTLRNGMYDKWYKEIMKK